MRFSSWFTSLLLLSFIGLFFIITLPPPPGIPLTDLPRPQRRVLLLPLDSRPPCLDFVTALGHIVGVEIIAPPENLLDYYSKPADTTALAAWTRENIAGCDYAILSIDQLLHGGLLASREAKKTPADADALILFLHELHAAYPDIPLYAFNILPRLTPPDSIDGAEERKNLMRYSRLADQIDLQSAPGASDMVALKALRDAIPPASLRHYDNLFADNARLNQRLIDLAADGTLARLIIGQDDGERYGIPNRERRQLLSFIDQRRLPENRVFFTHGADEIAQTLLAAIEAERDGFSPRIALSYNHPETAARILPYMAASMETTAKEKIRLLGGSEVSDPRAADFTLYLSANSTDTLGSRRAAADEIKSLVSAGRAIALVDLAQHFLAEEALLPFLIKNDTPLHALVGYAGWNTASNAIGTAAAASCLREIGLRRARSADDVRRLYKAHLTFLDSRFLEDYFYLKDIIDSINLMLRKSGYFNVNDLDLEHNARWVNDMIQRALEQRIAALRASAAFRTPITVPLPEGSMQLIVRHISADIWNPWPRTFEVRLRTQLLIEEIPAQRQ